MTEPPYAYKAFVTKVKDGDTVLALLDLGFHILHEVSLRLKDVYAPELTEPSGEDAKAQLAQAVAAATTVMVQTERVPKRTFERYVGTLYLDGLPYTYIPPERRLPESRGEIRD